jgi:hypothetical protein
MLDIHPITDADIDEEPKMTAEDYMHRQMVYYVNSLEKFVDEMEQYDDIPDKMTYADWREQWAAYLEMIEWAE